MKFSYKIPLAFGMALTLMSTGALYGIHILNQSVDAYRTSVMGAVENERMASAMLVDFKLQVQEWKDTLLRGKDPQKLDKYWGAFQTRERTVDDLGAALAAKLPSGEARTLVMQFTAAHAAMGQGYRKGFEAFKAAGFEPSAGDAAVAGIDRQPTQLLDDAAHKIAADSAQLSLSASNEAERATRMSAVLMGGIFVFALAGGVVFSRSVTRPLDHAVRFAHAVSQGDLSVDIRTRGQDEIAELLGALEQMRSSLSQVVTGVRGSAEGVATASAQIAAGNNDLSARTEEQAASLEQTAASMTQLSETVKQNADNARHANSLAANARVMTDTGSAAVTAMMATMQEISADSAKIAEITGMIEGIAFQTNILALNAAVEAARAGEQGRGFAVVAGEVRSLAQRASAAAKEIRDLIKASSGKVQQGARQAGEVDTSMGEVIQAIGRVTDIMGEITVASDEQSKGILQVHQAINQIDAVTQQNAALVEEAAAAAQSMQEQAARMKADVTFFRLA